MQFERGENQKIYTKKRCCVKGCPRRSPYEKLKLTYHSFPRRKNNYVTINNRYGLKEKVDCFDEWCRCLRVRNPSKHYVVCSLHFTQEDYNLPDVFAEKRKLKPGSIPSKYLPKTITHKDCGNTTERAKRAIKRAAASKCKLRNPKKAKVDQLGKVEVNLEELHHDKVLNEMLDDLHQDCIPLSTDKETDKETVEELVAEICEASDENCIKSLLDPTEELVDKTETVLPRSSEFECSKKDVGVQVGTNACLFSMSSLITDDHKLWNLCGIKNFKILDKLIYLYKTYFPDKRAHKLNVKDRIILTTMKLKLDMRFSTLSIFFVAISENHCRTVFLDTLKKLSALLKISIHWPSKEEIMNNMPHCFQRFQDTVVVLDCIEFKVERPRCLNCRIKLYSIYKSNFTVKFMTGVSPGGLLIFVSKAYGGRVSDKVIFEQSNIVNLIERGDAIMVDRRYLIDSICDKHGIKMYRPAYKQNKDQLSESDAKKSRCISSARVHVERMNQRIREFDILNNCIGSGLIKYVEEIMNVCCGLANLGSPILGDDKFM